MRVSLSCPSACSRRRPQAHIFVALVLTIGVGLLLAPSHALAVDSTTSPYQVVDAAGAPRLVVALDAGHGSVIGDVGAVGNGLYESNLTTVITDSFASRLEQYVGVSVVRTRPANGTYGSQSLDLVARTLTAQSAGADVFVSNHVNSGGGRGVEVWIPNASSYNYGFHTLGTNLGNLVLGNLTRLGFASRGLKSESYGGNSPESRYPDGSAADAFSVIRNSRLRGIPAILIEHGFIDNGSDAAKLGSMSTLMSMGQADADALASHYGLVSGVTIPRFYVSRMRSGEMQISWRSTQAQRYAVAIRRNEDEKWQTYTYDLTSCSYDLTSLPDGSPLIDGMTYEICVQGFKGSAWSDIDEGSRWITVAANPQNVTATPVGSGQISLSWSPVQGASKYAIAEYVDGNYVTYTVDCLDTSYVVSDLANGYAHDFLVQAYVKGTWSQVDTDLLVSATPTGAMRPSVTARVSGTDCTLSWDAVPGAERYAVAVWDDASSSWRTYTYGWTGTEFQLSRLEPGRRYRFLVQAYAAGRWSAFDDSDVVTAEAEVTEAHPIMGAQQVSADRMVEDFKSRGAGYPTDVYTSKGASTIEDFVSLLCQAANAEGVRPEVLYAQAMLETGYLRFGGAVRPEQCNFGGLGAVDSNPTDANTFSDVYTGLLAQAQHLKAYASTEPVNEPLVDVRFKYVTRGSAPYVEQLGSGKWASSKTYGADIIRILDSL